MKIEFTGDDWGRVHKASGGDLLDIAYKIRNGHINANQVVDIIAKRQDVILKIVNKKLKELTCK